MENLMVLVADLRSVVWQAQQVLLANGLIDEAMQMAGAVVEANQKYARRAGRVLDLNEVAEEALGRPMPRFDHDN